MVNSGGFLHNRVATLVLFSVLWSQSLWSGCADASAATDDSG